MELMNRVKMNTILRFISTILSATFLCCLRKRQKCVADPVRGCDGVKTVRGRKSSDTQRLAEKAVERKKRAHLEPIGSPGKPTEMRKQVEGRNEKGIRESVVNTKA